MKTVRSTGTILFLLLLLVAEGECQRRGENYPIIRERVTDLANVLTPSEKGSFEDSLALFERETSNQVAVLIIRSLEGEVLEDYSLGVSEINKFGKKGRDNGILLFIAMDDRAIRIEVGYGLEGALPDAVSDQIIRHEMIPRFRDGDYYDGIKSGLTAIMKATRGEYTGGETGDSIRRFSPLVVLLIFLLLGMASRLFGRGGFHRVGRGGFRSSGPWMGGFGGGGFGGGGSGGGGFSGGGGSFGGGGASGRW